ncbi:MAG: bacteriohemerythrin [Treponema sp.]|jgi:hemerythrin|nr:bacteriohemerythrin [Treponema sp.]
MMVRSEYFDGDQKVFVEWDERYNTGIPLIDEQHKDLLDLTNKLYEACLAGDTAANETFKSAIRSVYDYIKYHFSAEEKLLEKVRYPELASHKKEHEVLVKHVLENVQMYEGGKKFIPNAFVRTMREWILTHIAVNDKHYSEYIKNLKKQGALRP